MITELGFYLAGTAVLVGVIKYGFGAMKTKYETKPDKIKAIKELMESDGFKQHVEKRAEVAKSLMENIEGLGSSGIENLLDNIFGRMEILDD